MKPEFNHQFIKYNLYSSMTNHEQFRYSKNDNKTDDRIREMPMNHGTIIKP